MNNYDLAVENGKLKNERDKYKSERDEFKKEASRIKLLYLNACIGYVKDHNMLMNSLKNEMAR